MTLQMPGSRHPAGGTWHARTPRPTVRPAGAVPPDGRFLHSGTWGLSCSRLAPIPDAHAAPASHPDVALGQGLRAIRMINPIRDYAPGRSFANAPRRPA